MRRWAFPLGIAAAFAAGLGAAAVPWGADPADAPDLAHLGRAADFRLVDETGARFDSRSLRGEVVLVNFMFTRCFALCQTMTFRLAHIKERLREAGVGDVHFVSITLDPEHDRPEVLRAFAEANGYRPEDWSFLTGEAEAIRRIARDYGVFMAEDPDEILTHTLLLTLVDRDGAMRVQYLGERFTDEELLTDLRRLAGQAPPA